MSTNFTPTIIEQFPTLAPDATFSADDYNRRFIAMVTQGNLSQQALGELFGIDNVMTSENGAARIGAIDPSTNAETTLQTLLNEFHQKADLINTVTSVVTSEPDTVPSNAAVTAKIADLTTQMAALAAAIQLVQQNYTSLTALENLDNQKLNVAAVKETVVNSSSTVPSSAAVFNELSATNAQLSQATSNITQLTDTLTATASIVQAMQDGNITDQELVAILADYYTKTEVDDLLIDKADLEDVLTKTNQDEYNPSQDYNPATKKYVDFAVNTTPRGVPMGGETGEALRKLSNNDYDTGWVSAGTDPDMYKYTTQLVLADWLNLSGVYQQILTIPGLFAENHVQFYSPEDNFRSQWANAGIWMRSIVDDDTAVFECMKLPLEDLDVSIYQTDMGLWGEQIGPMQTTAIVLFMTGWIPVTDPDTLITSYTYNIAVSGVRANNFVHFYSPTDTDRSVAFSNDVWMQEVVTNNFTVWNAKSLPNRDLHMNVTQIRRGDV